MRPTVTGSVLLLAVAAVATLWAVAVFSPWHAANAAGTIAAVSIDADIDDSSAGLPNTVPSNTTTAVGAIDTCISVSMGDVFEIDVVMIGLPSGEKLAGADYDIDYDGKVIRLGNDDDADGKFDEDTLVGDGDEDADGVSGEEGPDGGGTIGQDPNFVLLNPVDFSKGNGNDTATWSDFHANLFKLSGFPAGPRDGVLSRIAVTAVGPGVTSLDLRDLFGKGVPVSPPWLADQFGSDFTIGNGGSGDAQIAVDQPCPLAPPTPVPTPTPEPTVSPTPTATPGPPGATERVSVDSAGVQGNSASQWPAISGDGRFVAFISFAGNLVADDTNDAWDVFVRDRQTGATERVSVESTGVQGDGPSGVAAISADGRLVAFGSDATNLVAGDTNNASDIFVHDRETGTTERVSVDDAGVQANNSASPWPNISADGRFVAFGSDASNLASGDTNNTRDIFVYDRQTGATERVSVDDAGAQANGYSDLPTISTDGRFVAFQSGASNLVAGDTNNNADVFVHDRQTGATERVSAASASLQANNSSFLPDISDDGRLVAFQSGASNLVADDTNNARDIFVHDRQTGATERVSVDSAGVHGNSDSDRAAISADGRFVAFQSYASNLVGGDTNDTPDIFVHDRQTGATERVSVDSAGVQGNGDSGAPAISADGRLVAFQSWASNLVAGDTNGTEDVFVHDSALAPAPSPTPTGVPTPTPTPTPLPTGLPTPTPMSTPTGLPSPTPLAGYACDGRPATIVGTDGKDVLFGTGNADVIVALGGNDIVFGMQGDDVICLSEGKDVAFGGKGNDRIFGEGGKDLLFGEKGDDYLDGGPDKDHCFGGSGSNTLAACEKGNRHDDYDDHDDDDRGYSDDDGRHPSQPLPD